MRYHLEGIWITCKNQMLYKLLTYFVSQRTNLDKDVESKVLECVAFFSCSVFQKHLDSTLYLNIFLSIVYLGYILYYQIIYNSCFVFSEIPIKINEWISCNPSKSKYFPRQLYIILPTFGNCYSSLSEVDNNIEFVETFTSVEIDRAGNRNRNYKNTIYKICGPDKVSKTLSSNLFSI